MLFERGMCIFVNHKSLDPWDQKMIVSFVDMRRRKRKEVVEVVAGAVCLEIDLVSMK
jgi:hypothetical protein